MTVLHPTNGRRPRDGDYRLTDALAVAVLMRSRRMVRAQLLALDRGDARLALRGLAAWFERMCNDPEYRNPPPEEAMVALAVLGNSSPLSWVDHLAALCRVIHLARELAACRQVWSVGDQDLDARVVALTKLELTLETSTATLRIR